MWFIHLDIQGRCRFGSMDPMVLIDCGTNPTAAKPPIARTAARILHGLRRAPRPGASVVESNPCHLALATSLSPDSIIGRLISKSSLHRDRIIHARHGVILAGTPALPRHCRIEKLTDAHAGNTASDNIIYFICVKYKIPVESIRSRTGRAAPESTVVDGRAGSGDRLMPGLRSTAESRRWPDTPRRFGALARAWP
jgi:hypothetical protein